MNKELYFQEQETEGERRYRQGLCHHYFEAATRWGVIIGLSHCLKCGKLSSIEDFPNLKRKGGLEK